MGLNKDTLELYIHIPFCIKKCDYCDFLSGPVSRAGQEAYVYALLREIKEAASREKRPVSTLFIGGGTPSVLPVDLMELLLSELSEQFRFLPAAECTIEANPGTLTEEKLVLYRKYGLNRISIGLQSPVDQELKMLGRIHDYREFLESYELARHVGFDNINVDLMFVETNPNDTSTNLRTVAALAPEHISAYSLIIEEGTPFFSRKLDLPDEDTEYRMYEDVAGILGEYGYHQYEISNYARSGFECRHNKGYWTRMDYLGLGLGAASLIGKKRFTNTNIMEEYLNHSRDLTGIRKDVEILEKKDEMGEFMFLGLRMTEGVSEEEFQEYFHVSVEKIYGRVIEKYIRQGLLERRNGRIFLTRRGIHVSNAVMADFLL